MTSKRGLEEGKGGFFYHRKRQWDDFESECLFCEGKIVFKLQQLALRRLPKAALLKCVLNTTTVAPVMQATRATEYTYAAII